MKFQLVLALVSLIPFTFGHIALWDEGMYGYDPNEPNQSLPVKPLQNFKFSDWWFHGYINQPPVSGKLMSLPSGGTYHGQVSCNKGQTTLGGLPEQQKGKYACDLIGPMHTADPWDSQDPKDVKGCGIAIAYKNNVNDIKPEDFTVISVNYTCPWFKNVDFQIPSDLPPCPEGGCHCMWGWVHANDAGSAQMYMNGYKCEITGAKGVKAIPPPKPANKCEYPSNTGNCTVGPKQPHFWYNLEGNNNPQGQYDPPFYNGDYGFMNGAQTDLFAGDGQGVAISYSSSNDMTNVKLVSKVLIAGNGIVASPAVSSSTAASSSVSRSTASTSSVSSSTAVVSTVKSSASTVSTLSTVTFSTSASSTATASTSTLVLSAGGTVRLSTTSVSLSATTKSSATSILAPTSFSKTNTASTSTSKPSSGAVLAGKKQCKRRTRSVKRVKEEENDLKRHVDRQKRRVEKALRRKGL